MKRFRKITYVGSALALTALMCFSANYDIQVAYADYLRNGEYNVFNKYDYRVEQNLTVSPDSIEAWINVPKNSLGGVFVGSYGGDSGSRIGGINLEIDALGRIKYLHNCGLFTYTFKNTNLMDGKWHHVAIVRNGIEKTVSLYLDGVLNEMLNIDIGESIPRYHVYFGVDPCFWNGHRKTPFEGYIKQVTMYHGAISQDRILNDMNNTSINSDDVDASLIGNWYLGEKWSARTVLDTSDNKNNCLLETYEKYVGLADNRDYDYSFIVFPDVQCMNRYKHERFSDMIDYVIQKKDELKIKFAIETGDLSDVGTREDLYKSCSEVMCKMNGIIPWSFGPGNHDYDDNCTKTRDTVYLNRYFPYSDFSQYTWFGGSYEEGKMENTYSLYDIGDIKYCVINLEFGPRLNVLRWAGRICDKYPDRRVIIQTHAYVSPDGKVDYQPGAGSYAWKNTVEWTSPQQFHDMLVTKHKNVFMAIGGHYCSDDIRYLPNYGDMGNKIHSFLINNQASVYDSGIGEDTFALFKVNETNKTMSVAFYSPYHNAVMNIQNQFEFYFGDSMNSTIGK